MDDKMSPEQVYNKTMGFICLKALMPIASLIVCIIAMKILSGVFGGHIGLIGALIWIVIAVGFGFGIDFFVGYKFKAGHVAVVTDAVSAGMMPDDQKAMANETVTYRFPSCNEYLAYKTAVKGAIGQLQKNLNTFAERKMGHPVLGKLISFAQIFIGMALSFSYDLVLFYTFFRDGKPLYTSAAEGVAIYYYCWKRIIENVMILAIEVMAIMAVVFFVFFAFGAAVLTPSFGNDALAGGLCAAGVAYFACITVKTFLDSRFMIRALFPFFDEARYAEITEEEYIMACRASAKFDKLYRKALSEPQNTPAPMPQDQGGY